MEKHYPGLHVETDEIKNNIKISVAERERLSCRVDAVDFGRRARSHSTPEGKTPDSVPPLTVTA